MRRVLCVTVCACLAVAVLASAVPATLLTNVGERVTGSLAGLEAVLRVLRPDGIPTAGPDNVFDVTIPSIQRIFVDFPRVVIEADDGVLLGPFSATTGVSEELRMTPSGASTAYSVPFASVGQIALNGHGLGSTAPRIWLGDRFLTLPDSCLHVGNGSSETLAAPVTSSSGSATAWTSLDGTVPASSTESGIPWWIGLLGVAALIALVYFNSGSSSS